jgi:hypothetical protein
MVVTWQPVPTAPAPFSAYWVWDGANVSLACFVASHVSVAAQFTVDANTGSWASEGVPAQVLIPDQWLIAGVNTPVVPLLVQLLVAPQPPQGVPFIISFPGKVAFDKATGVTENVQLFLNGLGRATMAAVADGVGNSFSGVAQPASGTAVMLRGVTSGKTASTTA